MYLLSFFFRKEVSTRRVKRWGFGLNELLQDPIGREQFVKFLDKEFSGENLKYIAFVFILKLKKIYVKNSSSSPIYRFWETVEELKTLPQKDVCSKVNEIWNEFLAPEASCPINVDSQSYEITKKNLEKPNRWCYDVAAVMLIQYPFEFGKT